MVVAGSGNRVVKIRYIRDTLLFSQQETISACCVSVVKIRVAWLYLIFTTRTQQPEMAVVSIGKLVITL